MAQDENERYFYLAGINSYACFTSLSVDMITSLIFINRSSRFAPTEKYIDIFKGSTDHIQDKIDGMKSSVDCSNE